MAAATRAIRYRLKIPLSSANEDLQPMLTGKRGGIALNKKDLANPNIMQDIIEVDKCFNKMQDEVRPSSEYFQVLGRMVIVFKAKKMHGFAIENGLYHSVLRTSLLDFYAKFGDMEREVHGNQKNGRICSKMASSWIWNPLMLAITLSTVQAVAERWNGVEELRRCMNNNDLMKPGWSCVEAEGLIHGFALGWSSVEAEGLIHGFASGDRQLPQMLEIYEPMDVICRN